MLAPNPIPPAMAPMMAPPAPKYHDVTVLTKKDYACARVEGIPPEEFGIEKNAKSIHDCGYCFHEVARRASDLIASGYDADQVKKLPSYSPLRTPEQLARDTVDESRLAGGDQGLNEANRLIRVTEHYIRLDYEGDGRTALYRITTAGEQAEILTRDGEEDIVEIDAIPIVAMTPIIITHRFFGRSIADLVMDIQRIKTALLRGALDNLYLHNNPRVEVSESMAGPNTLSDLLVSRPMGIVRTKLPGGLNWQVVPDITGSVYPALQYFDATREWRTGVSRQGQGVDPNSLQNQVATIANQMFDASQAKVRLIARIFAETGIKDLFSLLHGTIRKNGSKPETVKLRNEWVEVNPRDWKERNDLTINVGLGTGSRQQQLAQLQLLIGAQEKAVAVGLVSKNNLYNSAKELVKLIGRKDEDSFFTAPKPPAPQGMPGQQPGPPPDPNNDPLPPPEDPKKAEIAANVQIEQTKAQSRMQELTAKNEIEKTQAQADIATNNAKLQNEYAMMEKKFQLEQQMAMMTFELDKQIKLMDAELRQRQVEADLQAKVHDHQMKMQMHEQQMRLAAERKSPHEPA